MDYAGKAKEIAVEVASIAGKTGRRPMFAIENTAGDDGMVFFPPIRYAPGVVCGVVKIRNVEEAKNVAKAVDGTVDTIVVDVEKKIENLGDVERAVRNEAKKSRVLTAKLNDMTVDAADSLVSQLLGTLKGRKIAIIGGGNAGSKLALKLVEREADVVITRRNREKAEKIAEALNIMKNKGTAAKVSGSDDNIEAVKDADMLICFTPKTPAVNIEMVNAMKPDGMIIDGGIGTIYPDAIGTAVKKGIRVLRLDMRTGFAGGMTTILETENLIKNVMGKKSIAGVHVVAGGLIGERGDIVVDDIAKPTQVIGIADGKGGIAKEQTPEEKQRMGKVLEEIKRLTR